MGGSGLFGGGTQYGYGGYGGQAQEMARLEHVSTKTSDNHDIHRARLEFLYATATF